jgi:uncharacterized protein involved in type VI secretion and phage assembly
MSGDKWGWYTLPEVGDLVVVVFIAGDIRQPVVLGGIWNKTDTAAEPLTDGKNEFRGYKSRSGHRFLLDDTDKGKVSIADKTDNLQLTIGQLEEAGGGPNKHTIAVPKNGGTAGVAAVSMSGQMKILCPSGKLKIEGKSVCISADDKVEINAATDLIYESGSTTDVKASNPAKIDAPKIDIN